MRLFCFGLGYSARRVIARGEGVEASGTTRAPEPRAPCGARRRGVRVRRRARDEALLPALARAQVLSSRRRPAKRGDPALARFAREIAAAPDLERILYLSSVGVYGDRRLGLSNH